ncbi:hypothetical protein ACV229_36410 [Burkholderia sp. MR1-5-21]
MKGKFRGSTASGKCKAASSDTLTPRKCQRVNEDKAVGHFLQRSKMKFSRYFRKQLILISIFLLPKCLIVAVCRCAAAFFSRLAVAVRPPASRADRQGATCLNNTTLHTFFHLHFIIAA